MGGFRRGYVGRHGEHERVLVVVVTRGELLVSGVSDPDS